MVSTTNLLLFSGASLLLVLTPGPNMAYLISRSICQGRRAGLLSLAGVATGFLVHMLAAAVGVTTLFLTVPVAYEILKWLGACYLLWMAWQAVKPDGRSRFATGALPPDSPARLYLMGFLTNLLNPKVAVFYLSLVPQFVVPGEGSVFAQSLALGMTQILVSVTVNLCIVASAAGVARWFACHPFWLSVQRYVMGGVLAGLALRLALEQRRQP